MAKSKKKVIKPKSLFNHLDAITKYQDPNYWSTLSEDDKRTWSNYMINRFLSMNLNFIELVSDIQPYVQDLPPEILYKTYIGLIPRGSYYAKYIKAKNVDKYESFLVDLVILHYQCSKLEALDYIEILYSTHEGKEYIKELCEKYGTESKMIIRLKLKLKKKNIKIKSK